ncbi:histidine kinase [Pedobacter sp. HMWF019]|uniref:GAF domain-containing sensor histidine kinase n=1 Tax=Pedobacter sp. HMWF019 TaxID=2056856 RepID=UPI000D3BE53A|nr:GAF domain-containing sensor histidine kinase [Pedobacter sp. HMWF019]PTS92835.1 histidine kinase [Pedobacter sp. HMWF019]
MDTNYFPVPKNEFERLKTLSSLNLDYTQLQQSFQDLTYLAAKIAGTKISLINLIDTYTQWTIGAHGIEMEQKPREDSICQYTITKDRPIQIRNLSADKRFKNQSYTKNPLNLRYYLGLPLQIGKGINIGTLCLLDKIPHQMDREQLRQLKIIAQEIVHRLKLYSAIDTLQTQLNDCRQSKKKVAHDIRSPLSGIMGLAQILEQQNTNPDESLQYIQMILHSSRTLMELSDEMLRSHRKSIPDNNFNLTTLKEQLLKLYAPQTLGKGIALEIIVLQGNKYGLQHKSKLLQIVGNLLSNSIKFTPVGGNIDVILDLQHTLGSQILKITVSDSGIGMSKEQLELFSNSSLTSTRGTQDEYGFGFGLPLVCQLVSELKGHLQVHSQIGQGSSFTVILPQED